MMNAPAPHRPSNDETWWTEVWSEHGIEFVLYLALQFAVIPTAIVSLVLNGLHWKAICVAAVWLPGAGWLVRDLVKAEISLPTRVLFFVSATIGIALTAYAMFVA